MNLVENDRLFIEKIICINVLTILAIRKLIRIFVQRISAEEYCFIDIQPLDISIKRKCYSL